MSEEKHTQKNSGSELKRVRRMAARNHDALMTIDVPRLVQALNTTYSSPGSDPMNGLFRANLWLPNGEDEPQSHALIYPIDYLEVGNRRYLMVHYFESRFEVFNSYINQIQDAADNIARGAGVDAVLANKLAKSGIESIKKLMDPACFVSVVRRIQLARQCRGTILEISDRNNYQVVCVSFGYPQTRLYQHEFVSAQDPEESILIARDESGQSESYSHNNSVFQRRLGGTNVRVWADPFDPLQTIFYSTYKRIDSSRSLYGEYRRTSTSTGDLFLQTMKVDRQTARDRFYELMFGDSSRQYPGSNVHLFILHCKSLSMDTLSDIGPDAVVYIESFSLQRLELFTMVFAPNIAAMFSNVGVVKEIATTTAWYCIDYTLGPNPQFEDKIYQEDGILLQRDLPRDDIDIRLMQTDDIIARPVQRYAEVDVNLVSPASDVHPFSVSTRIETYASRWRRHAFDGAEVLERACTKYIDNAYKIEMFEKERILKGMPMFRIERAEPKVDRNLKYLVRLLQEGQQALAKQGVTVFFSGEPKTTADRMLMLMAQLVFALPSNNKDYILEYMRILKSKIDSLYAVLIKLGRDVQVKTQTIVNGVVRNMKPDEIKDHQEMLKAMLRYRYVTAGPGARPKVIGDEDIMKRLVNETTPGYIDKMLKTRLYIGYPQSQSQSPSTLQDQRSPRPRSSRMSPAEASYPRRPIGVGMSPPEASPSTYESDFPVLPQRPSTSTSTSTKPRMKYVQKNPKIEEDSGKESGAE